jgi:MFS family permease
MIAEFADYRSWIAWVPLVAVLAVPIVLRRLPVVSGALIGAFCGGVVISMTMPLGSNAEQLGANVAAGLGGGAVVGALVGLVIGLLRPRPRDASVIVVGWALGLGVLGALLGGFGPSVLDGPPDLEVGVLGTIAVGGGIGWSIGAAIGWRLARDAPPPQRVQRWILAVAAVSVALFGAGIVATIQSRAFGPSIDSMTRAERNSLPMIAALYCIDVALAVSTMAAVAARGIVSSARPADPAALAHSEPSF